MKPAIQPPDSTGLAALSQYPPRINPKSPLLGSIIDLPLSPLICCSLFTASPVTTPAEQLAAVESARRRLVMDYASVPLADSLLSSVHMTKDHVGLYVFALGSTVEASLAQKALASLQLANLDREHSSPLF